MPENPFVALAALSAAVLLWAPVQRPAPEPARHPVAPAASVRLADGPAWVVRPAAGQRLEPPERAVPDRGPGALVSVRRPTVLAQLPAVVAAPAPAAPPAPAPPAPAPAPLPVAAPRSAPPAGPAPAAAAPAPAAVDEAIPAPPEWLQQRADEALALIHYPWERLGYEIHFHSGRTGTRAQTLRIERRIEVFARPGDSARRTAYDVAHEIAHVFDFTLATEAVHTRWLAARGLEGREWYGCNACPDLATPAGDFAESFAYWLLPGVEFGSRLGPPPNEAQRALIAEMTALAAD